MKAIKTARKLIQANPESADAKGLARLVQALEAQGAIKVAELYALDYKHFELAIEILQEWRIDRYYASKAKLVNVSNQVIAAAAGN